MEERAASGVEPPEPGPEEVVLLAQALENLAELVDLGAEGAASGDLRTPAVVGHGDPASDEEEGTVHRRRVAQRPGVLEAGRSSRQGREPRQHGSPEEDLDL